MQSIVDARSVSTVNNTPAPKSKRKRKSTPTKQAKQREIEPAPATPFADVNLPEVEQYKKMYGQNLNACKFLLKLTLVCVSYYQLLNNDK